MYKDTTTFPSRPSKLSTTSVHNQTFLQDWGFPPEHCHVTARQLGVFTGFGGLQHCSGPRRPRPAFSTASRARRGSFSQPDDVFAP